MAKDEAREDKIGPPQHVPGTNKGSEKALGKDEEKRRQDREDVGIDPSNGPAADQGS